MGKLRWYKRDPDAALAGMAELTLQERGAYNTIIDLLYSRDGVLADDPETMRRMLHCHGNEWRAVRSKLIAKRKIWITDDGRIMANRVERTLDEAANLSETQRKRAGKGWETRRKQPENAPDISENLNTINGGQMPAGNATTTTTTTRYKIHEEKKDGLAKRNGTDLRPLAEVLSGDKPQARADADMVRHLVRKLRMDQDVASRFVRVARDPAHPEHEDCRAKCLKISRDLRLGWFA